MEFEWDEGDFIGLFGGSESQDGCRFDERECEVVLEFPLPPLWLGVLAFSGLNVEELVEPFMDSSMIGW